ncbi:MAG: amino acid permease [Myxococcales bacterium]|nr:amino acid permease [Myxococcales bacterium]
MTAERAGKLERSLSLLDVMALGVNAVIGQGIFLLPGLAAAMLGPASSLALVLAALLALLIALCFAEVGSRFDSTGGAYTYARETFGGFVGFEVGWMLSWVGIISWAALSNGFCVVLGKLVPAVNHGALRYLVSIGLMAALAAVNLRRAKLGAAISTFFSVAKLLPVAVYIVVGVLHIRGDLFTPFAPKGYGATAEATLLLLYAFVGFESSVVPAGEMRDPQRAVPKALLSVMALVCGVYLAVFLVTIGTFPGVAGHKNPVAAASAGFLGEAGGLLIAVGIVVSVFGINAGAALVSPRKVYALAERGDLPRVIARVDERSGVPRAAVLLTFVLAAVLSLSGTFKDLAILGVVARFVQYIPTCLAVLVLRRRDRQRAESGGGGGGAARRGFRVPLGPVIPLTAVALCVWLIANTAPGKLLAGLAALVAGVPFFLWAEHRRRRGAAQAG